MKKVGILVCMILMATLLLVSSAMADDERTSGAFTYRIKGNGTAVITGYDWENNEGKSIYIPRMLDGYTVTEIGEEAFARLKYDENGVISYYSSTTAESITIPDTVIYIGEKAFMNTRFVASSITIPASVQYIGAGAFSNLGGIQQFVVDATNPVYATINGVLYNKQKKELVAFPPEIQLKEDNHYRYPITIPEGIISIGDYAFFGYNHFRFFKLNYKLPESLKYIGDYAFAHNVNFGQYEYYWQAMVFPDALESIGIGAFYDNMFDKSFEDIDLSNTRLKEISELAFYGSLSCNEIIFPETLTKINDKAFKHCFVWEVQKFPSSLKYIGNEAFADSTFDGISFPQNAALISIGDRAFAEVRFSPFKTSETVNVVLPNNLESIGEKAFWNCERLNQITLPDSVRKIGDNMCDRNKVYLEVTAGSYAAVWASENGYTTQQAGQEDTSWLN